MLVVKYIQNTIDLLEQSVQEETMLDEEDYQEIALKILKCDSFLTDKKISAHVDVKWFNQLTELFYEKMKLEMGEDDN